MMPTRYPELRRLKPGEQHFYPTPDTTDRAGLQKRLNSAMRRLASDTGRRFETFSAGGEDGILVRRVDLGDRRGQARVDSAEEWAESEDVRRERLKDFEADDLASMGVGSLGFHEAMHMASVMSDMVDRHLGSHPSVVRAAELHLLAHRAFSALWDLYQRMGAQGLEDAE